jgi:hypothetical protein
VDYIDLNPRVEKRGKKMKKYFFVSIVVALCFIDMGCISSPTAEGTNNPPSITYNSKVESDNNSNIAVVAGTANWYTTGRFKNIGLSGFTVSIKNNTDKVIRIIWDKSSITSSIGTENIFLEGQRFINSSQPMPPTSIPAQSNINKDIYSAKQVQYDDGWEMQPLGPDVYKIILCIQSGEVEDSYTITFTPW